MLSATYSGICSDGETAMDREGFLGYNWKILEAGSALKQVVSRRKADFIARVPFKPGR